jgi:hypothetical protein
MPEGCTAADWRTFDDLLVKANLQQLEGMVVRISAEVRKRVLLQAPARTFRGN